MYIRLLGPLSIVGAQGEVAVTSRRQRLILTALALNHSQVVTINRLVDLLWAENPPSTAREQVQNCVGMLRRQLRSNLPSVDISRHTQGYRLDVNDSMLDVARFKQLCSLAQYYRTAGNNEGALAVLQASLNLWRGRPAEDLEPYGVSALCAGLEELRVGAIETYIRIVDELGIASSRTVSNLMQFADSVPYYEEVHLALARALDRSNRSAEALDVIRRFRSRIADELGIDASDSLSRFEIEIRRRPALSSNVDVAASDIADLRRLLTSAMNQLNLATSMLRSM